jgi:hypothetical protein
VRPKKEWGILAFFRSAFLRPRPQKRLSSVFFRPDSGGPNIFGDLVETKRKLGYVNQMNIVEYCLHTVGDVENPVDNVKNSL